MIIKEGSAEDICNWFSSSKMEEVVLCIFLATSSEDVELLSDLIYKSAHVDAIIGEKVGLLLCAPQIQYQSSINEDLGVVRLIGAKYQNAKPSKALARNFIGNFDLNEWQRSRSPADQDIYREASIALARSTARLVPDFMAMYSIDHRELPCIVTLIKGVDAYCVTDCKDGLSFESFSHWLGSLRDIVTQVERDLISKNFCAVDVERRVKLTSEYMDEAQAKLHKIEKAVVGIYNKYCKNVDDALWLTSTMTSSGLKKDAKVVAMQKFLVEHPEAQGDERWAKIFLLQDRIEELNSLASCILNPQDLRPLSAQLDAELQKLNNIYEAVSRLQMPNHKTRKGRRSTSKAIARNKWEALDRVNTTVDVAEKISNAIKVITRLLLWLRM